MELYNKIKDLEDFLDKEENIIAIKNIQEKIKNNEEIMTKINNKEELNNIVEIREYKKLENKVNYMILSINNLLKEIVKEEK
ncbi:MAG: hypothetical protein UFD82_01555 [Bacilli bacterium]|jgi:hypothetical protein|nr:hypothetical protein [Bacilli bacterium]